MYKAAAIAQVAATDAEVTEYKM